MPRKRIDYRLVIWLHQWVEWEYSHLYGRAFRYATDSDRRTVFECRTISRGKRKEPVVVFSAKQCKGVPLEAYVMERGKGGRVIRCPWPEEFGIALRKLPEISQCALITDSFQENPGEDRKIATDLRIVKWSDTEWHNYSTQFRPDSARLQTESERSWIDLGKIIAPKRRDWMRMKLREEAEISSR